MIKIENYCVDCKSMGLHCLGDSCSNKNTEVHYCDDCEAIAEYVIDGNDFCEKHADKYLQEIYDNLTTLEKAQALDVVVKMIE